jgi:hypothetical protein
LLESIGQSPSRNLVKIRQMPLTTIRQMPYYILVIGRMTSAVFENLATSHANPAVGRLTGRRLWGAETADREKATALARCESEKKWAGGVTSTPARGNS